MRALKDVEWKIHVLEETGFYFHAEAPETDDIGIDNDSFYGDKTFKTPEEALDNWKQFAELNGFDNWEIVE